MPTHLYRDEDMVEEVTRKHIAMGRLTFQYWLLYPNEKQHAAAVLDIVKPGHRDRIVSLGCGVGGMEAHWARMRPDLRFTLVNRSPSQLAMCACPGERIRADVEHWQPEGEPFDLAVLAYVLGHVNTPVVLANARALAKRVLVLDMFDDDEGAMRDLVGYECPWSDQMREHFECLSTGWPWHLTVALDDESPFTRRVVERTKPAMWITKED